MMVHAQATEAVSPTRPDAGCPGGTGVVRLMLNNFRNYASASLAVGVENSRMPVVLTGSNGAGKTNILEALSLLSPGRGLRRAKLREMQRRPVSGDEKQPDRLPDRPWAVSARIDTEGEIANLGTGLAPSDGDAGATLDRRIIRVDGESASGPSVLGEFLSMMWVTPDMDRLFRDGASARRRFLDRLVLALHSGHGTTVNAYEKTMRERNQLLETGGAGADPDWLSGLERTMAEHAVAIAAARQDLVNALAGLEPDVEGHIFPRAVLSLDGLVESWLATGAALEVEERFAAHLASLRMVDRMAGRATEESTRRTCRCTTEPKTCRRRNVPPANKRHF